MANEFEFDLGGFEKDLDETLKRSRDAFMGKYKGELNELAGLSKEEIDAISPGITDLQKYDELIAVVKEASRVNIIAIVVDKYINEEKTFSTITLDDGTDTIESKPGKKT